MRAVRAVVDRDSAAPGGRADRAGERAHPGVTAPGVGGEVVHPGPQHPVAEPSASVQRELHRRVPPRGAGQALGEVREHAVVEPVAVDLAEERQREVPLPGRRPAQAGVPLNRPSAAASSASTAAGGIRATNAA